MDITDMYKSLFTMTNKQAAEILKTITTPTYCGGRGYGKTFRLNTLLVAIAKAIKLLENTPDENIDDHVTDVFIENLVAKKYVTHINGIPYIRGVDLGSGDCSPDIKKEISEPEDKTLVTKPGLVPSGYGDFVFGKPYHGKYELDKPEEIWEKNPDDLKERHSVYSAFDINIGLDKYNSVKKERPFEHHFNFTDEQISSLSKIKICDLKSDLGAHICDALNYLDIINVYDLTMYMEKNTFYESCKIEFESRPWKNIGTASFKKIVEYLDKILP